MKCQSVITCNHLTFFACSSATNQPPPPHLPAMLRAWCWNGITGNQGNQNFVTQMFTLTFTAAFKSQSRSEYVTNCIFIHTNIVILFLLNV